MNCRWLITCFFLSPWLVGSVVAQPSSWGLGAIIGKDTGLSLNYRESAHRGVHIIGKVVNDHSLSFEFDILHYLQTETLSSLGCEVYSGLGLYGKAQNTSSYEEEYDVVLPLGIQWQRDDFPVLVFVEPSALVGPLPLTHIYGRFQLGVRALL